MTTFESGSTYLSRGVADRFGTASATITAALKRHLSGDWGEVSDADQAHNNHAVTEGERLLSAYTVDDDSGQQVKIWIITEADRQATTVLLPDEY